MRTSILIAFMLSALFCIGQQSNDGPNPYNKDLNMQPLNPGVAFVSALIIPGSGHIYAHQIGGGIGIHIPVTMMLTSSLWMDRVFMPETTEGQETLNTATTLVTVAGLLFHVVQAIDAPFAVRRFNERNGIYLGSFKLRFGESYGHLPTSSHLDTYRVNGMQAFQQIRY